MGDGGSGDSGRLTLRGSLECRTRLSLRTAGTAVARMLTWWWPLRFDTADTAAAHARGG